MDSLAHKLANQVTQLAWSQVWLSIVLPWLNSEVDSASDLSWLNLVRCSHSKYHTFQSNVDVYDISIYLESSDCHKIQCMLFKVAPIDHPWLLYSIIKKIIHKNWWLCYPYQMPAFSILSISAVSCPPTSKPTNWEWELGFWCVCHRWYWMIWPAKIVGNL